MTLLSPPHPIVSIGRRAMTHADFGLTRALSPEQQAALTRLLHTGCCGRPFAREAPDDASGAALVTLKRLGLAEMRSGRARRPGDLGDTGEGTRRLWWLTPPGCGVAREIERVRLRRQAARPPAPCPSRYAPTIVRGAPGPAF